MAEYEFLCRKCNHRFTIDQGWDDERPTKCEQVYDHVVGTFSASDWDFAGKICGGPLVRIWSMPNVVYRAGGFNTTDKRLEPKESDFDG